MSNYERIAEIIRYLDRHQQQQPQLADLAREVGLSPFHLHRVFSDWAGVTPKDFLQCLTLTHAKKLLQEQESVLDAALGAGVSGPGRLHDLCVTLEAASPGELKDGGRGWQITFGFAETPFGQSLIAVGPRGICYLAFTGRRNDQETAALQNAWPRAELRRDDKAAAEWASIIFRQSNG